MTARRSAVELVTIPHAQWTAAELVAHADDRERQAATIESAHRKGTPGFAIARHLRANAARFRAMAADTFTRRGFVWDDFAGHAGGWFRNNGPTHDIIVDAGGGFFHAWRVDAETGETITTAVAELP